MGILSIQSHVAYGYVGNKAAVFPLQSMGYDVWGINTVQFSNHTGYGSWSGDIFPASHIAAVVQGLIALGQGPNCEAVLSGYLGSGEIGQVILEAVLQLREMNPALLYLCDPVMGDFGRGVFVKPDVLDFLNTSLMADIITPNHFEAEVLSGLSIQSIDDAKRVADFFHEKGIKQVLITSINLPQNTPDHIHIFLSVQGTCFLSVSPYYELSPLPNGMGDLFSALYLGYYLKEKNAPLALHQTLSVMDEVMRLTQYESKRELAILSATYGGVQKLNEKIKIQSI